MSEAFYDAEIAPVLLELAKKCEAKGMPFLAIVQYGDDDIGRTEIAGANPSLAFRITQIAARAGNNVDSLFFGIAKMAKAESIPHNSIVLDMLGNTRASLAGEGGGR